MSGGILPAQRIRQAIEEGWVGGDPSNVQPASLDLRLGAKAYALRCSFLPDDRQSIESKLGDLAITEFDIGGGRRAGAKPAVPDPAGGAVSLPGDVRGRPNPKSSTGRIDVFTRVISEASFRFDEIPAGYEGPLFLEIVPRSFAIRVQEGLTLNQLRLVAGDARCSDAQIVSLHEESPLCPRGRRAAARGRPAAGRRPLPGLDLERGEEPRRLQGPPNAPLLDLARSARTSRRRSGSRSSPRTARIILQPEEFYLLISRERVRSRPARRRDDRVRPDRGRAADALRRLLRSRFRLRPAGAATGRTRRARGARP